MSDSQGLNNSGCCAKISQKFYIDGSVKRKLTETTITTLALATLALAALGLLGFRGIGPFSTTNAYILYGCIGGGALGSVTLIPLDLMIFLAKPQSPPNNHSGGSVSSTLQNTQPNSHNSINENQDRRNQDLHNNDDNHSTSSNESKHNSNSSNESKHNSTSSNESKHNSNSSNESKHN
ncbi:MAG: hypothetical protein K940chlam9_00940, partial [Chlamydiae bacterium]|nr:hypothetical protein [Chlamydiota bacterium]